MSTSINAINTNVKNLEEVRLCLQQLLLAIQSGAYAPSGAAGGDLTETYPNPTVGINKVGNTKLAQMAANSIKGNNTGGLANALDLTAAQVKTLLAITESDVANLVTDLAAKALATRIINTTAPITGGGDLTADRTISIGPFAPNQLQITAGPTAQTFSATGTWTCPAGITSVQVECWGAGGGGGGGNNVGGGLGGGAGGGGAYSKSTIPVVPGTVYTVTVGTGGPGGAVTVSGTTGGDSWFSTSGTILAKGGGLGITGSSTGAGGAGGASGSGVGTTVFSGGTGANRQTGSNGGGGGGSAGTGSIGNNGSGVTGGVAVTGGGAGGNASVGATASPGGSPGGGGGGGDSIHGGGAGSNGQVIVTIVQETLTLNTAVGGSTTTPTLTFPPVTGNLITSADIQTVLGAMFNATAIALIRNAGCMRA